MKIFQNENYNLYHPFIINSGFKIAQIYNFLDERSADSQQG